MWMEEDSLWVRVGTSLPLLQFIVAKGYVAVDGTSLTVCDVNRAEGWFTLMLVYHTQQNVIFPSKRPGSRVNIEVDVMGKYAAAAVSGISQAFERLEISVSTALAKVTDRLDSLESKVTKLEGR
jgi:riboflavin synthase